MNQIEKSYQRYIKQFKQHKDKYLEKYGIDLSVKHVNKAVFAFKYVNMKSNLVADGKPSADVVKAMISAEIFATSEDTAKNYYTKNKALVNAIKKKYGVKSYTQVIAILRTEAFSNLVTEYREELKLEHPDWSSSDISKLVSRNLFDSE